jgi:hypothetical protein
MSKTLTFEIPDDIYELLQTVAAQMGRSIETVALEWLASTAPKPRRQLTPQEVKAAEERFRQHFGAVNSGDPHSGDNERIDADLAREYANTHEDEAHAS